jgi:alkylation response protein AidB-like acyl-CoA dehydrogenase
MDFKKTEEQELLLESVRELVARVAPESYIAECDKKHEYPVKLSKALLDGGFITLGLPKEHGGVDADVLTQVLVIEELAKAGVPSYLFLGTGVGIFDIISYGTEEQIRQTKEALVAGDGRMPFSFAITEPQAGSDDAAIATTVTRKNGKVYLNGHKTFLSAARESPYMLVVTRNLEGENPHKSMSWWWAKGDAPGIKTEPLEKIGWWLNPTYEAYLENVEIEEKDLIGKENEGFMQLMKGFEIEKILMSTQSLGWAEAAFEDAAKYANHRVQFGKSIGTFQVIEEKIVNMEVKIRSMRNLIYQAAWEKDNGLPAVQITSSLAKYYSNQAGFEVVNDAMQIFGGLGYTSDLRVSRLWRDMRGGAFGGGTAETMIHNSGRFILKQYR